ncbi:MAG: hypothetical protein ACSHX0_10355 [Akkermansiaceae bacterium]
MKFPPIIIGIGMVTALICVLVLTRVVVNSETVPELEIREVELDALPEPPPLDSSDLSDQEISEPAISKVTSLQPVASLSIDTSSITLPQASINSQPQLTISSFALDTAPAPLPAVSKPIAQGVTKSIEQSVKRNDVAKTQTIAKKTKIKSEYSEGELDARPRLLHSPSVTFPRSLRSVESARAVVRVEILPSGKSKLIAVHSSTHPEIVPLARRIANGSRFTVPTYKGQAVKVVRDWPIVIKNPKK